MRYGIPYQGSKNTIAEWVVDNLPSATLFIDMFAGGCAVTHAAMLSGKYQRFMANDLTEAPEIFKQAAQGEFKGLSTVLTREEFQQSDDDVLCKLRIGNAYNYAAGIVGNLMREAMDNARAWTETAIRQKDAHDHAD